jgi:RimJ/RimL family protein N-acetyltransferase
MTILIREALPEDAGQCIRLIQRITSEPTISIGFHPGEFQMSIEQEVAYIQSHAAAENSLFLVALSGEEVVGVLTIDGGRALSARHAATLGISVDKVWRGQGVGSQLLQHAVDWARQNRVLKRIELHVFVRNEGAVRLYERFGFVIEGRRRRALFREGQYHDNYVIGLLL